MAHYNWPQNNPAYNFYAYDMHPLQRPTQPYHRTPQKMPQYRGDYHPNIPAGYNMMAYYAADQTHQCNASPAARWPAASDATIAGPHMAAAAHCATGSTPECGPVARAAAGVAASGPPTTTTTTTTTISATTGGGAVAATTHPAATVTTTPCCCAAAADGDMHHRCRPAAGDAAAPSHDSGLGDSFFETSYDRRHDGPMFETDGELRTPLSMLRSPSDTASPLRSFTIEKSPFCAKLPLKSSPRPPIGVQVNGSSLPNSSRPRSFLSFCHASETASTSGISSASHNSSVLSTVETPSKRLHYEDLTGFGTVISPFKPDFTAENDFSFYSFSEPSSSLLSDDFAMYGFAEPRSPLKMLSPNKSLQSQQSPTKRPHAVDLNDCVEAKRAKESPNPGKLTVSNATRIKVPYISRRLRDLCTGQSQEQKDMTRLGRRFLRQYAVNFTTRIPLFKTEEEFNSFDWDMYEYRYGNDKWSQRSVPY